MADDLPLGDWEKDRPALMAVPVGDRGDVADLDSVTQFQVYVARLINRREQNEEAEFDLAAAFVLVSPEEYEQAKIGRSVERLIHTGGRRLTGRLHFVMASATSSIVEEYGTDDNALFSRLEAVSMSQHPTLLYVPQHPSSSLTFYPKGTADDDGLKIIPLKKTQVTADAISEAITDIYKQELVTPDAVGPSKLWKNAAKGYPFSDAELRVQQLLRTGLITKFTPCSVRQEQTGKIGRTDLEIVDDRSGPPGQVEHHALLELKVLRSRGETGSSTAYSLKLNQAHIEEGLNQAHTYGVDKHSKIKMLCCFDMRDSNDADEVTFAHIKDKASSLSVLTKRWFLYRDSAAYRAAIAAAVGATPSA
jgi:hypothetical protein